MDPCQRVLVVDAGTDFYRVQRYPLGGLFGPVDLGLHLAGRYRSADRYSGGGAASALFSQALRPA